MTDDRDHTAAQSSPASATGHVYSMSEDEDYIVISLVADASLLEGGHGRLVPVLVVHRDPSVADSDSGEDRPARYVANVETHVWGDAEETLIRMQFGELPPPVEVLTDDAPQTSSYEELIAFCERADAKFRELLDAGDERVAAHYRIAEQQRQARDA